MQIKDGERVTRKSVTRIGYGDHLYHVRDRNADGTPLRVRVNGRVKLWKTRPEHFRLPCKYGMYQGVQITHENCHNWRHGYGS